jgi:aspartyl-tRNA(Asn)/glutamyl-tRNA(Gln) amidotransferase subunit C
MPAMAPASAREVRALPRVSRRAASDFLPFDMTARNIHEIDVAHVAKLARLNLTADEAKVFQEQLGRVLEYAEKLREVAGDSLAEPNEDAGETPAAPSLREDETRPGFTAAEALSNAPRQANDLFIVPKVVE